MLAVKTYAWAIHIFLEALLEATKRLRTSPADGDANPAAVLKQSPACAMYYCRNASPVDDTGRKSCYDS